MSYIYFVVVAETKYFQTVKICGNLPELGGWNPKYALSLFTTPDSYPKWCHEQKIQIPAGSQFEFKCIIIDNSNVYWEDIPNRTLKVEHIRNYINVIYGVQGITLRTYQKYEYSAEFDQDELDQVQRLAKSKEFRPLYDSSDSSDNDEVEQSPEMFNTNQTSIKQLDLYEEIDWEEIINVYLHNYRDQNYFSNQITQNKIDNVLYDYGSQDQLFEKMRKRSQCSSVNQIKVEDQYVICVCFKIPIKINLKNADQQVNSIETLLNKYEFNITSDPYYASQYNLFIKKLTIPVVWFGWLGIEIEDQIELKLLQNYLFNTYHCFGIPINGRHYINTCFSQWIEPIFLNLSPSLSEQMEYVDEYLEVNQIFAKVVNDAIEGNAFKEYKFQSSLHSIFIYDYHFFLIPSLIKDQLIQKNELRPRICTIINRNFPNPINFRMLQHQSDIISSLLISDVISFIELNDLFQFINCVPYQYSKLSKMQGMSSYGLDLLGRKIVLDYGNNGLNHKVYDELLSQDGELNKIQLLKDIKSYKLLAVDRVSIYTGLEHKFRIVQQMHKLYHNVKLIQIVYITNDSEFHNNDEAQSYYCKLKCLVDQINEECQEQIISIKLNASHQEILKECIQSDCFFKSCLRENISLNYLEYIYVRQYFNQFAKLILSVWCKPKLPHITINPYDIQSSAIIIQEYLNKKEQEYVVVPNSNDWLARLNEHLNDCENLWIEKQLYNSSTTEKLVGSKDKQYYYMPTQRFIGHHQVNVQHQRIFIVDLSQGFRNKIQKTDKLLKQLAILSQSKNYTIIIISDLSPVLTDIAFDSIPGVFQICQDGLYIKQNGGQNDYYKVAQENQDVTTFITMLAQEKNYDLQIKNNIYYLEPQQKANQGSLALSTITSSTVRILKSELSDYVVISDNFKIIVRHKHQQIGELIKIICNKEYANKGLISYSTVISFEQSTHEIMSDLFQNRNTELPLFKKFHYIAISNDEYLQTNCLMSTVQDIIQLLQKHQQDSENIIVNTVIEH